MARGLGKPCVAAAGGIGVDLTRREAMVGGTSFKEGDLIPVLAQGAQTASAFPDRTTA